MKEVSLRARIPHMIEVFSVAQERTEVICEEEGSFEEVRKGSM